MIHEALCISELKKLLHLEGNVSHGPSSTLTVTHMPKNWGQRVTTAVIGHMVQRDWPNHGALQTTQTRDGSTVIFHLAVSVEVLHSLSYFIVMLTIFEPPHDKTNKVACAPSEDSDQPGRPPSRIRVFRRVRRGVVVGAWPGGVRTHPPSWTNDFKIMQFFTRNWVYTPNFGLQIRILLRFAPPL